MAEFKPMVKMMTTEPSVELKLKKGGKVAKKADGGMMGAMQPMARPMAAMPARGGAPAAATPMAPSLAARRRAMRQMGAGPSAPVGLAASRMMKEGGKSDKMQDKAMIKKAFKQHDMQEHKGGKGTKLALKKGGDMSCATGGAIPSESSSGDYATTKVYQAKADKSPAKTGGVKNGNAGGYKKGGKVKMAMGGMMGGGMMDGAYKKGGMPMVMKDGKKVPSFMAKKMATGGVVKGQAGYATGGRIPSESTSGSPATTIVDTGKYDNAPAKTGGVSKGNAGGFKRGGATKKHFATGGSVNSAGSAVAMPQGRKPIPSPVEITQLAGTYKKGGKVAPGNRQLQAINKMENATAMRQAKMDSNLKYGPANKLKLAEGGSPNDKYVLKDPKAVTDKESRELEEALNPLSMVKELYNKARGAFGGQGSMTDKEKGSVTRTKESVTVSPGKKRGGRVC